jgi:predicted enzyme related to lactoylglutathione lyase
MVITTTGLKKPLSARPHFAYSGVTSMIKAIKFASVPVRDQDQALEFYTQKLGFQVLTDQPHGDKRWIEIGLPGNGAGLALFTPDGHRDRIGTFTGISFYSDDVEETYKQLTARGVEFSMPPKKFGFGWSSVFKDQDGNQFALSSK